VPYIIDNRAGSSITIPDGALNNDFAIQLVGRNYANYGQPIANAFVDLLDNFAHGTAPTKQTNGQIWYDSTKKVLRVYDSVGGQWVPLTPLVSASGVPSGENASATQYYDKTNSKFYINDGTGYKMVGIPGETNTSFSGVSAVSSPSRYGTKLRNIFLVDSASVPRAVTAIMLTNSGGSTPTYTSEEHIVALFSGHTQFTAGDAASTTEGASINYYSQLTQTGGIGSTISPGINLRTDNTSTIGTSSRALRSDAAYKLNIGSYGSDSSNVSASAVFHSGADLLPATTDTIDLGSSSKKYAEGHISALTTGSIVSTSGTTAIGSLGTPFTNAYATNVNVGGALTFSSAGNLGTTGARAGAGYFTSLDTSAFKLGTQVYPTADGTSGQQLFTNGSGALFWRDPVSTISNIFARGGTVSANTTAVVNGVTETTFTIDIGAGTGITVNADDIAVTLSGFTTDDLTEGSTNRYSSSGQVAGAIAVVDAGGLGSLSKSGGTITYTGPSDADIRGLLSGANGVDIDAGGQITADASEIDHDGLNNFVANEHIDHSSVSISAGTGLTGGGTIDASRTLNVIGGTGITVNADSIEVTPADIRGLFTAGSGISINASGQIANTGSLSDPDTTDFVTKAGSQSIGGQKTFNAAIVSGGGISMGATDVAYTGSLSFAGASGSVTFGASGSILASDDITAFSDSRLKENVMPIENALEKCAELTGVTFDKINTGIRGTGLIAQDLQKVLPEAVHEQEDGMLSVAYGNTIGLLINAINELQAEVAKLKQESSANGNK
jgi:hypothetical protein